MWWEGSSPSPPNSSTLRRSAGRKGERKSTSRHSVRSSSWPRLTSAINFWAETGCSCACAFFRHAAPVPIAPAAAVAALLAEHRDAPTRPLQGRGAVARIRCSAHETVLQLRTTTRRACVEVAVECDSVEQCGFETCDSRENPETAYLACGFYKASVHMNLGFAWGFIFNSHLACISPSSALSKVSPAALWNNLGGGVLDRSSMATPCRRSGAMGKSFAWRRPWQRMASRNRTWRWSA